MTSECCSLEILNLNTSNPDWVAGLGSGFRVGPFMVPTNSNIGSLIIRKGVWGGIVYYNKQAQSNLLQ